MNDIPTAFDIESTQTLGMSGGLRAGTRLDDAIARARNALLRRQRADGHWQFELEADVTIPAEYVLLEHYLDRIDAPLQRRIALYLRARQGPHGGWPLFHGGAFNLSASVKAYFALKAVGDAPDAPHMARARAAILAAGGAERSNVFTRVQLALFGQVPWDAVPVMPIEIMLLPRWFPFHLSKVAYWSRTVLVPLLVLQALRPRARNPHEVGVRELFVNPPETIRQWTRGPYPSAWGRLFKHVDVLLRWYEPRFPARARRRAVEQAVRFVRERLNGEDGLGAIYPAIANSVMMFDVLGCTPEHQDFAVAWRAVRNLIVDDGGPAYCQPCLSPVWDTALAAHAIAEASHAGSPSLAAACSWLRGRQITEITGDYAATRSDVRPGGWAFQYNNPHYPDVDDTAVVGMLLHRQGDPAHAASIERARAWIVGMQSRNGGWGAFDADNTQHYLNHIPFADHGALLDPPSADVTARCVSFLAQIGTPADDPTVVRGLAYLRRCQERDGSWFRPLGDELHLRHLVGLVRAERAGLAGGGTRAAPGGGLAPGQAARGWRLGGGQCELRLRPGRPLLPQHAVADGLGAPRPDGGRRGRSSGHRAGNRPPHGDAARRRRVGRGGLHGGRVPEGVLPSLSRLPPVLPAARARPLSRPHRRRRSKARVRLLTDLSSIGIVCGLAAEARLARPLGCRIAVGGGTAAGARKAARRLIGEGVTSLVSFGLAGGLDPGLHPGDLLVPSSVLEPGSRPRPTDTRLSHHLGCGTVPKGVLLAGTTVIAEPAMKQRLWNETGAMAIDLESGPAAEAALEEGLPFAALRAICDPAWRRLPTAALVCLGEQGRIDVRRLGLALLRAPRDLPALIVLGSDAAAGRQALRRRALALALGRSG